MAVYSYFSKSSPYYKRDYALWIKRTLDTMMNNPDKDFRFSCTKLGIKSSTLLMRINQGWAWLIDHDDKDDKYYLLRKKVSIHPDREYVTLRWKKSGLNPSRIPSAEPIEKKYAKPLTERRAWRSKLAEFIEEAMEGETYEETSVNVDEEDRDFIYTLCLSADDIAVMYINNSGFKVIRNLERAEKWRMEIDDNVTRLEG